jgi:hypothetical protein
MTRNRLTDPDEVFDADVVEELTLDIDIVEDLTLVVVAGALVAEVVLTTEAVEFFVVVPVPPVAG